MTTFNEFQQKTEIAENMQETIKDSHAVSEKKRANVVRLFMNNERTKINRGPIRSKPMIVKIVPKIKNISIVLTDK